MTLQLRKKKQTNHEKGGKMNSDIYEVTYTNEAAEKISIRLAAVSTENAKDIFTKTFAYEPSLITYCGKIATMTDCCEGAPNE
jgi:hypothetical protein